MRFTLSTITSSWDFFRRQPALLSVGAWLIFLPMLAIDSLNSVVEGGRISQDIVSEATIGIYLLIILLSIMTIWGQCCIMVAGRRMLQTKAGRSRTSFSAVASQAKPFVIPFILTNLLRGCIAALWMLPFFIVATTGLLLTHYDIKEWILTVHISLIIAIPGIIYIIRTIFTPVIIIGENTAYRAAMQRSKDAVKGNFWNIVWILFLLIAFLFVIPALIVTIATVPLPDTESVSYAAVFIINDIWITIATILVNLSLVQMYERYRAPVPR